MEALHGDSVVHRDSPEGRAAIVHAAREAVQRREQLLVLHVLDDDPGQDAESDRSALRAEIQATLESGGVGESSWELRTSEHDGDQVSALRTLVDSSGADLLVVAPGACPRSASSSWNDGCNASCSRSIFRSWWSRKRRAAPPDFVPSPFPRGPGSPRYDGVGGRFGGQGCIDGERGLLRSRRRRDGRRTPDLHPLRRVRWFSRLAVAADHRPPPGGGCLGVHRPDRRHRLPADASGELGPRPRRAGPAPLVRFIAHYLTGVVYPESAAGAIQTLVALGVVTSWAGYVVLRVRTRAPLTPTRPGGAGL